MGDRLKKVKLTKAQSAYIIVENFIDEEENTDEKTLKKFKSYATKLPTMIKTNGLINSIAFIKGKKSEKQYVHLYNSINDWYTQKYNLNNKCMIKDILEGERAYERAVTIEILSLLVWIKRFAVSEINMLLEKQQKS